MKRTGVVWVGLVVAIAAVGFGRGLLAGQAGEAAVFKIGYVDLNRALNEVEEGKKAKTRLEVDGKEKQKKLEIMQNELKALKDDLDKQRLILSADALKQKEGAFQQKLLDLQKTSMDFEKEFSAKEAELTKPIAEKLKGVIEEMGRSGAYGLILPKEMALYAPAGGDLTNEIIATYNKKAVK